MNAIYGFRMPAGIPGTVNRVQEVTIEPGIYQANALPIAYGVPVTVDATTRQYRGLTTGDTAGAVIGFAARPYPMPTTTWGAPGDNLGQNAPNALFPTADIMKRGYIEVLINAGTAAKGNPVYCRIASPSTGKPIGGIEAAADGANTIVVPNAYFTGPADTGGNCEVAYNL